MANGTLISRSPRSRVQIEGIKALIKEAGYVPEEDNCVPEMPRNTVIAPKPGKPTLRFKPRTDPGEALRRRLILGAKSNNQFGHDLV